MPAGYGTTGVPIPTSSPSSTWGTARAIEDYDKAIRLNTQNALAYINRGLAYTQLGMDAEAQQDIERAVELGFARGAVESSIAEAKSQR